MKIILKYKLAILGMVIGAIVGYIYYLKVGCESGSCAITSSPRNSTLYGALLGGLVLDMFKKKNVNSKATKIQTEDINT